ARNAEIDRILDPNNAPSGKRLAAKHQKSVDQVVAWLGNPEPWNPDQVRDAFLWLAHKYIDGNFAKVYLGGIEAALKSVVAGLDLHAELESFLNQQLETSASLRGDKMARMETLLNVLVGEPAVAKAAIV